MVGFQLWYYRPLGILTYHNILYYRNIACDSTIGKKPFHYTMHEKKSDHIE